MGRAIAVNDQTRVNLQHQCRVEGLRELPRDFGSADIPTDMPLYLVIRQSEIPERFGDALAGVVAGQKEGRSSSGAGDFNGGGFVRSEFDHEGRGQGFRVDAGLRAEVTVPGHGSDRCCNCSATI